MCFKLKNVKTCYDYCSSLLQVHVQLDTIKMNTVGTTFIFGKHKFRRKPVCYKGLWLLSVKMSAMWAINDNILICHA